MGAAFALVDLWSFQTDCSFLIDAPRLRHLPGHNCAKVYVEPMEPM